MSQDDPSNDFEYLKKISTLRVVTRDHSSGSDDIGRCDRRSLNRNDENRAKICYAIFLF